MPSLSGNTVDNAFLFCYRHFSTILHERQVKWRLKISLNMCALSHLEMNSFLAFIHAGGHRGGQDADRIAAQMYGLPPSITEMMESPCAGVARPLNLDRCHHPVCVVKGVLEILCICVAEESTTGSLPVLVWY